MPTGELAASAKTLSAAASASASAKTLAAASAKTLAAASAAAKTLSAASSSAGSLSFATGPNIVDESMENLVEHNMAEDSANLNIQKLGRDDELGTGNAENRWPGWPGDNVFRMLVPSQKVGGIIGRKGEIVKKICEESKARVKILNGPPGEPERAVIISAKEEPDASISPAMDCLFRVHKHIVNGLDEEVANAPPNGRHHLPTRLLVTATQARFLIGKQGATIKSFQEASKAVVRVVEGLPPVALQDDKVVEILGEPAAMHKALELVANHLRKFLVDRSVLPLFEMNMLMQQPQMEHHMHNPHMEQPMYPQMEQHMHHPYMEQHMPSPQLRGPHMEQPMYPQMEQHMHHPYMEQHMPSPQLQGPHVPPLNAGGPGYEPNPHDNFYPPPDYAVEKPPHRGIFQYGREAPPMGGLSSMNQPQETSSRVTRHMQVPLSYADAVIGSAGANISYIRRASRATVSIQESDTSGEMTVEIVGSATQVQTAQQLVHNSMAAASVATPTSGPAQDQMPPAEHGYDSYPDHGFMDASQANAGPGGRFSRTYYGY